MSVDFDPYRNWLGIPANEAWPINYYRLCGVELFEADTDIISLNADKQLDYVRRFSSGPQGEIAERLLTEISKAKLTLLKPERKYDYDLQLRRATSPAAESSSFGTLPPVLQPAVTQAPAIAPAASLPPAPAMPPAAYVPPVLQPNVPPPIPEPLVTQPAVRQPPPLQPNAPWPMPQQQPVTVAYPAPLPPRYSQPFSASGSHYPAPVMQPGSHGAPALSAPAAYDAPQPTEEAAAEEEPANPFNPFGNAPKPAGTAVEIAKKPARKSSAHLWVIFGGLIGVCIALVILLKSKFDTDPNQDASPQAKATPKKDDSSPKEPVKKEEKTATTLPPRPSPPTPRSTPPSTPPSVPARTTVIDIPNGVQKIFEHKITMQGDWKKYLHSTQNVEVHQEEDKIRTTYWRPVELNKEGSLIYYFPVDFFIKQGTLQATLKTNVVTRSSAGFDQRASVYIEVSADGKEWHRVESLEPGTYGSIKRTMDIGKYLIDARGVYVKALLFSSKSGEGGKSTSQFLRAYADTKIPGFTLTLRGLQPGLEIASNSEPEEDPFMKPAPIPKKPPVPAYEEVVVEPPQVPTPAQLVVKSENEAVLLALQEWRTARESFISLKERNDEQYLRRFDEEIKQYQSSTVMKPELIQEHVGSLNLDKEKFIRSQLYSLSHAMLPHNQVVSSYLKEQTKIEQYYETLIDRLRGEKLEATARAYEALKYHDELLQPLRLCALSFKKTSNSTPEILSLCSNGTINLEPNSKWRIDRKMQLIFNRSEDPAKEYSFAIEPSGQTMKETTAVSIATLETYAGQLPVLKRPVVKKRVPVQK